MAHLACLVVLLGLLSFVESTTELDPACDIHKINPGHPTPREHLLLNADPKWLYPSVSTIEEWYKIGKKECEMSLPGAKNEMGSGHAAYYTDANNIPSTPQCRGRNTLLDYSGMILYPFGPYKECTTYSKCWFGVLSCGTPKNDNIKDTTLPKIKNQMQTIHLSGEPPAFTKWSLRAMHLLTRLLGAEIVVPDTKYVTLPNGDDVIIAQYVLTRPHPQTRLEIRMFEFYPSALFDWTPLQRDHYGMHNVASLYLGGSETRCRPWTTCRHANNCCGCDEKSFIFGSPALFAVADGSSRCPDIHATPLPVCEARDSSQPGRWIASALDTFTPHCNASDARNVLFHKDVRHIAKDNHLGEHILRHKGKFNITAHHYAGPEWFEASGDPCLINSKTVEDMSQTHWFYAPYTCKYHFYNSMELHKCLLDQKLSHIHVAGDSMSRDLFSYISLYLGVPQIDEAELKHLTNDLNQNNVKFHSGKVLLSEGYSWDYNPGVMKLVESAPLPDIYITNYAYAHRGWHFPRFQSMWNETEYQYWTKERPKTLPMPKYMFYQNNKELTGRRNVGWTANMFRQGSDYLARNYTSMGFNVLDEFLFSTGRYDYYNPNSDGWHFSGTKRQMEVVALFNMVCNDWFKALKPQQKKKI